MARPVGGGAAGAQARRARTRRREPGARRARRSAVRRGEVPVSPRPRDSADHGRRRGERRQPRPGFRKPKPWTVEQKRELIASGARPPTARCASTASRDPRPRLRHHRSSSPPRPSARSPSGMWQGGCSPGLGNRRPRGREAARCQARRRRQLRLSWSLPAPGHDRAREPLRAVRDAPGDGDGPARVRAAAHRGAGGGGGGERRRAAGVSSGFSGRSFPGTTARLRGGSRHRHGAAWNARARFPAASTLKLAIAGRGAPGLHGQARTGLVPRLAAPAVLIESDNDAANQSSRSSAAVRRSTSCCTDRVRRHVDGSGDTSTARRSCRRSRCGWRASRRSPAASTRPRTTWRGCSPTSISPRAGVGR